MYVNATFGERGGGGLGGVGLDAHSRFSNELECFSFYFVPMTF